MRLKTQHTPGPWKSAISPGKGYVTVRTSGAIPDYELGRTIAHMSSGHRNIHEDAALIAAAPELLEQLKIMVAHFDEAVDDVAEYTALADKARAAIAKATGH